MIKFLVLISFRGLFVAGEHLDKDTMQWARRAISAPVYDNWWQTGRSFLDTRKKLRSFSWFYDVVTSQAGSKVSTYFANLFHTIKSNGCALLYKVLCYITGPPRRGVKICSMQSKWCKCTWEVTSSEDKFEYRRDGFSLRHRKII